MFLFELKVKETIGIEKNIKTNKFDYEIDKKIL